MRSPVRIRLAIVAAGIVLLGACSTSTSTTDATSSTQRTSSTARTATTDAAGSATTPDATTSTAPTTEPGGTTGGDFCLEMSRVAAFADDEFEDFEFGDDEDFLQADFEAMKTTFLDITETMQRATGVAPAEIRSDMEYLASFFEKLNEGIAAAESPEELFGVLFALGMEAEDDDAEADRLDEAEDRIEDFVEQHCGFEMEMDD